MKLIDKKDSEINPKIEHHRIFVAIKKIDETAVIITFDQVQMTHSKKTPVDAEYKKMFNEFPKYRVTNRVCNSFTLEYTHTVPQFKYSSKHNGTM